MSLTYLLKSMISEKLGYFYMKYIEIENIPGLLSHIPDPPKKLYAEGDTELLSKTDSIYVCIVGPRKPSAYGIETTKRIVEHLSLMNVITVSGAAYGIDGIVHKTSMELGIQTIAIPGSGIDDEVFYPRAHLDLKHEILDHGGLIVNEFEPLVRSAVWTFPIRNRLMAGMSHITIVVEAEKKSGTLITAHLAADFGREVLAVPGSIYSTTSAGTHELISKGATLCASMEILTEVLTLISKRDDIPLYKHIEDTPAEKVSAIVVQKSIDALSQDEKKVFNCIQSFATGVTKPEIEKILSMSTSEVSIYVTLLELHGLIKYHLGKIAPA